MDNKYIMESSDQYIIDEMNKICQKNLDSVNYASWVGIMNTLYRTHNQLKKFKKDFSPHSKITSDELICKFLCGNSDFSNYDLSGIDLSDFEFDYIKLMNTNLQGANLKNVVLYGANLSGANLSGVDLTHTNLRRAKLSGAKLEGCNGIYVVSGNAVFVAHQSFYYYTNSRWKNTLVKCITIHGHYEKRIKEWIRESWVNFHMSEILKATKLTRKQVESDLSSLLPKIIEWAKTNKI